MEEQPDPAIEAQRATAASAYEQERAVRVARNRERLAQIGVSQASEAVYNNKRIAEKPWPPDLHGSHDITVYSSLVDNVGITCWL